MPTESFFNRSSTTLRRPLGRRALEEIATVVKPETLLAWHRRLTQFNHELQSDAFGDPLQTLIR